MLPSQLLATSTDATTDPTDDLRCPICFALMLAPRRLPGCGATHTFCAPCISFWLQLQRDSGLAPTCPIDRRVVAAEERPEVDSAMEAAVNKLLVRCPNFKLGCTAQFCLGEGVQHLRLCNYRTVQCPNCSKPQSRERLESHRKSCFIECSLCGTLVPRADSMAHSMGLCLAKPHASWRSEEEARAFSTFRDATKTQLHALLPEGEAAPISDWKRAHGLLHALLSRAKDDHASLCDDDQGRGRNPLAEPPSASWDASPSICLRLAAECRARGWRGPWLTLSLRACELDPTSLDARLRCAEALLGCGKASEACEAYKAARLLDVPSSAGDDGLLEALCGEAVALDKLGRADEASALWARARRAPLHNAPPQLDRRARWIVASARSRVAFGDLVQAEDALVGFLTHHDSLEAQCEYASLLELCYLDEVPSEGPMVAAVVRSHPPPQTPTHAWHHTTCACALAARAQAHAHSHTCALADVCMRTCASCRPCPILGSGHRVYTLLTARGTHPCVYLPVCMLC